MTGGAHQKVNAGHLKRNAYLYVRQSTLRQVFENTESTKRQYGLRQHAIALGWPVERIIVIAVSYTHLDVYKRQKYSCRSQIESS